MNETRSLRVRQALPKIKELNDSRALQGQSGGFLPFLIMLPFQIAQDEAQKQAIKNQMKANGK